MTAPRQILSGATYLVTRRCAQRQFLLRPSETTNAIVAYVLAAVAARYGILVHACCVLSDHLHLVITDPRGEVPRFAQKFFGLVARALNAHLGRRESFWKGPGSYSLVRLESPEDALEKCAYTLANPVAAGLVEQGEEWPGLWSGIAGIGAGPRLVERPLVFFKQRGPMPAMASLEFVPPPGTGSAEEFRARLAARVAELEREAGDLRKE
jgi:putative transposase